MSRLGFIRSRLAALRRDERGFTLIELLLYAVLSVVVVGAAIMVISLSFHQQNSIESRSVASDQAEAGLQQLTQDLRNAVSTDANGNTKGLTIASSGATTSVSFYIPVQNSPTTLQQVTWSCPNTTATGVSNCTRTIGTSVRNEIIGVQSMAFTPYNQSNPPSAIAGSLSNSTSVSSMAMTLTVRVENYGVDSHGTVTTAVPGTTSNPIVLQAQADLRNFG